MKQFQIFWPVKKPFKADYNNFGDRVDYYKSLNIGLSNGHNGTDIVAINPASPGFSLAIFPLYSGIDGWVYNVGIDNKGGLGVELITNEKFLDTKGNPYYWKIRYWHMLKDGILVKVGQKVMVGDFLGWGDNTGISGASHCHEDGKPGDVQDDVFVKAFPNNGFLGAVDLAPYKSELTAYELRSNLTAIAEAIQRLSGLVADLIRRRKK